MPTQRITSLLISFVLHAALFAPLFMRATPTVNVVRAAQGTTTSFSPITNKNGSAPASNLQTSTKKQNRSGKTIIRGIGKTDGIAINERENYILELMTLIDGKKIYPLISRRLGESGRVIVRFDIHRDGSIENARIISQTGSQRLNMAALDLVSSIQRFKPLPKTLVEASKDNRYSVEVPIEYVLN